MKIFLYIIRGIGQLGFRSPALGAGSRTFESSYPEYYLSFFADNIIVLALNRGNIMLLSGRVKWYDKRKGYGFVESPQGDIFLHHSYFSGDFILSDQDLISFEVEEGEKGLRAKNITKVG